MYDVLQSSTLYIGLGAAAEYIMTNQAMQTLLAQGSLKSVSKVKLRKIAIENPIMLGGQM